MIPQKIGSIELPVCVNILYKYSNYCLSFSLEVIQTIYTSKRLPIFLDS